MLYGFNWYVDFLMDDTFLASDPSTEMNLEAAAPRMARSNYIPYLLA